MSKNRKTLNTYFKIGIILSIQIVYIFHRWMYTAFLQTIESPTIILQDEISFHQMSYNYVYSMIVILMFIIQNMLWNKKKLKIIQLIEGIVSCLFTLACVLFVQNYPVMILTPEQNRLFLIIDVMFGLQMGNGMFLLFMKIKKDTNSSKNLKIQNALFIALGFISALIFNYIGMKYYYFYVSIILGVIYIFFSKDVKEIQEENQDLPKGDSKFSRNEFIYRSPKFNYFFAILIVLSIWYIAYIYLGGVFEKMEDYNNQEFTIVYFAWIVCMWLGLVFYRILDLVLIRKRHLNAIMDLIHILICILICFVFWLPNITNTNYMIYYLASGFLMIIVGYYLGKASDLVIVQRIDIIIISIVLFFLITIMGPESHFINYFWTPYNFITHEEQLIGLIGGFIFIPFVLLLLWILRQIGYSIASKRRKNSNE